MVREEGIVTDAELVERCAKGDDGAAEELYRRFRLPFYAYFNRMLNGDRTNADDLFQELWIRIFDKIGSCRNPERFAAWSFQVARNLLMQHFRNGARRGRFVTLTLDGDLPETAGEPDLPDETESFEDLAARVDRLLEFLPPLQREVFQLRRSGLSFKEIAELQKCPLNTALSRMHYCMTFLRKGLKDDQR